jgi:hypothetical protein
MLLAMATGTGKTFTLVNQIFRLMEAGVAKRILFLVDRRALAAQNLGRYPVFRVGKICKTGQPWFPELFGGICGGFRRRLNSWRKPVKRGGDPQFWDGNKSRGKSPSGQVI